MLRRLVTTVRDFYADRRSGLALLVSAIILIYGGGAVLFWFHAIYLGEGGPAVSPWLHWALDSTAGFIGLIPPIAVILPVAARAGTPARFAVTGGVLLAFATAPGPLLHDTLVARGTFVADRVERLFGRGYEPTGEPQELPLLVEAIQQVGAAIPVYVTLFALAWLLVHRLVPPHRTRGAGAPPPDGG